jgi:hypothetical protein
MGDVAAIDRPVFSVLSRPYTWRDVVAYAEAVGVWRQIVEQAAAREADVDPEALDAAATAFRRDRGLLAADDLETWLEARGLTVESWLAYVRRSLVDAEETGATEASEEEVWAEAMCSGRLEEVAEELADRLAVSPDSRFEELETAFQAFAMRVADDDALEREIASARVEWIRVHYRSATFTDSEAAAEVALAVRADGALLAQVSTLAGVAVENVDVWMEDADPALAPLLVGACEGELLGPIPVESGLLVAEVVEKTPVDPADRAVRARAAKAVADRAVRREADEKVMWHELA